MHIVCARCLFAYLKSAQSLHFMKKSLQKVCKKFPRRRLCRLVQTFEKVCTSLPPDGGATLQPGCHFRTTQILELKNSQRTSCLGLNQVCYCSCFLNTWRNTAASVGLDLDSLALWWFVELWSQIWSGPYLKCFYVLIKKNDIASL